MGRLRKAEKRFNDSRKLFTSAKHAQVIESAWPLFGLGLVEQGRRHYDAAAERFDEAANIWQGDLFGMAVCDACRAELFLAQGDYDRAIETHQRSELPRQSNEDKFGMAWALRVRGYALLGQGQGKFAEARDLFFRGKTIMHDYGSAYGESALTPGLCHARFLSQELPEFERSAAL